MIQVVCRHAGQNDQMVALPAISLPGFNNWQIKSRSEESCPKVNQTATGTFHGPSLLETFA